MTAISNRHFGPRTLLAIAALALIAPPAWAADPPRPAKNVILVVVDGGGFNTWRAADMYQGKLGKQVYDGPGWVKLGCTTFPLTLSKSPTATDAQNPELVYDPAKAWDPTPAPGEGPGGFAGYKFLKFSATDSAAAATALSTGKKAFNNAINWSDLDFPLSSQTIAEIAKCRGRSVGVITTVPWSHATPACLGGAHSAERDKYAQIAREMLAAPYLDLIMGAGHPEFDDDGQPRPAPASAKQEREFFQYVGGKETWAQLKVGTHPGGWKLIETKAQFEALRSGPTPAKVLGTAQVATTLQQHRKSPAPGATQAPAEPFSIPQNANVPDLATMTRAALNCLDDNPAGFYLMIEAGAVDWANHANQPDRMIEEQSDFLRALDAVAAWVDSQSNWDETLVILTADHESGLLWGPESDTRPFDPIVDSGPQKLPGMRYNSKGHSNELVPLFARGAGSELFAKLVRGTDDKAAAVWTFSGQYVDNTDVFRVMEAALRPAASPSIAPSPSHLAPKPSAPAIAP